MARASQAPGPRFQAGPEAPSGSCQEQRQERNRKRRSRFHGEAAASPVPSPLSEVTGQRRYSGVQCSWVVSAAPFSEHIVLGRLPERANCQVLPDEH